MTVINQDELAELSRLDQVLMWSIISINASNLDGRNTYVSDNAAIREESKDYIQWSVLQDDKGNGQFTFTALLPIVNPHPLQDKESILDRVWSYSPYDPDLETESGITGYGENVPFLPNWVDTTEKLLAVCAVIATKVCKLAPLVRGNEAELNAIRREYWGNCQYQITDSAYGSQMTITGYLTLDWHKYINGKSLIRCLDPYSGHASNVSCNFPSIRELFRLAAIDLSLPVAELIPLVPPGAFGFPPGAGGPIIIGELPAFTAESLIDSYNQNYFIDDALPDWYKDAIDNPPPLQTLVSGFGNISSSDAQAPKLIESLPICKEQDPAVVNYGKSPLANVLNK